MSVERDEHKLVVDTLSKLENERKAFRLIGGILVERTVGEVLPAVSQNYEGVSCILDDFLWAMLFLSFVYLDKGVIGEVGWIT